jgi:hypothetical protein
MENAKSPSDALRERLAAIDEKSKEAEDTKVKFLAVYEGLKYDSAWGVAAEAVHQHDALLAEADRLQAELDAELSRAIKPKKTASEKSAAKPRGLPKNLELDERIVEYVKDTPGTMHTKRDIASFLGVQPDDITAPLARCLEANLIGRPKNGPKRDRYVYHEPAPVVGKPEDAKAFGDALEGKPLVTGIERVGA